MPRPSLDRADVAAAASLHLFPTCLGDLLSPDAVEASATVLEAIGCAPEPVVGATCCGQPAFNSGYDREARRVARRTLRAIPDDGAPIVVPAGSCAAMMRLHWRELFHGDRDAARALRASARVAEWSLFVAGHAGALEALRPYLARRVGYHDSCHMLRELRIQAEPRALLAAIEGLELVELQSSSRCCGFGGTFAVRYPDVSVAMADTKLDDVERARVDALVSCDGGCLLQLGGRLARRGSAVRAAHLAEILAEAIAPA
jgi:L-lactate dehydrogenase complex protein LldE